mgnify:CR=1 FL=1
MKAAIMTEPREKTQEYNGCISILSSRIKCMPVSVKSLWDNWNYRYNYPVYIYYFDDIYDNPVLQHEILKFTKSDVRFISIPYQTPAHVPEEELFYHRKNLWYVATGRFGISRKGYLHMCDFYNNPYGYPNTEFDKYDYILNLDDEALFTKEVPYNFFDVLARRPEYAGALKLTDPKQKPPKQGNFDTRVGMVAFVKEYIKKYSIEPKEEFIRTLLSHTDPETYFHGNLTTAASWVYETSVFRTPEWKQWSHAVNDSGGVYKYRWADVEMVVLFFLIHYGVMPYDFKTVDEGYHNQGALRYIQDYAPGVKDSSR